MSAKSKLTQAQLDGAVVVGWIAAAEAAREPEMVKFYQRILTALQHQCALPSSIVEALNSGDGVYRP